MIDIKTLRIGSHISINGERVEVESLQGGDLVGCITPDNDWFATESWRFEPISITPALLQESDFKPLECDPFVGGTYWQHNLNGYDLEVTHWAEEPDSQRRDWTILVCTADGERCGCADITYLHELENIIYQCCGVELIDE